MVEGLGIGAGRTVVLALLLIWAVIGLVTLTMPGAFAIWLLIGLIGAAALYGAGYRLDRWLRGEGNY